MGLYYKTFLVITSYGIKLECLSLLITSTLVWYLQARLELTRVEPRLTLKVLFEFHSLSSRKWRLFSTGNEPTLATKLDRHYQENLFHICKNFNEKVAEGNEENVGTELVKFWVCQTRIITYLGLIIDIREYIDCSLAWPACLVLVE